MPEIVRSVVDALNDVADTSMVWPRGLLHPGGPHRVLRGTVLPVSIGEDECAVFGRLVETFRPQHCFIVGTGFGFSSCCIAHAMAQSGGRSVVSLDGGQEGAGQRAADVSHRLTHRMGLLLLKNKTGLSPADTASAVEADVHQLVFIDGEHRHPQVTRDLRGILPFTDRRTIFVWHDFWLPGIPQAVRAARDLGIHCLWLPTSCEMVAGTRDATIFARLQRMFGEGVTNPRQRVPLLAPAAVAKEFIQFQRRRWKEKLAISAEMGVGSSRRT